ncbi:hypothetical protein R1sor_009564 [Riccia sorocarpa]|uniref:Uncharacterized protein n=1 Tax=Riccia sorocarpa TaxID=122646 RepID=A0ABD3HVK9_9MARC
MSTTTWDSSSASRQTVNPGGRRSCNPWLDEVAVLRMGSNPTVGYRQKGSMQEGAGVYGKGREWPVRLRMWPGSIAFLEAYVTRWDGDLRRLSGSLLERSGWDGNEYVGIEQKWSLMWTNRERTPSAGQEYDISVGQASLANERNPRDHARENDFADDDDDDEEDEYLNKTLLFHGVRLDELAGAQLLIYLIFPIQPRLGFVDPIVHLGSCDNRWVYKALLR